MNKKEEMAEKIRKLLNLSENNDNENQAMAALALARKLMREYGIEEESLKKDEKDHELLLELYGTDYMSQIDTWNKILVNGIAKLFDCKCFLERYGKSMKYQVRVFFIGMRGDVALAKEVWPFFMRYVRKKANEYFGSMWGPKHRTFAEMFSLRVAERINALIEEEKKSQDPEIQKYGIVLANKQNQIAKWVEENLKLEKESSHIKGETDRTAARIGYQEGDKVNLNFRSQITGKSEPTRQLPG